MIDSTSLLDVKHLLRFAQFKRRIAVRMPARKMLKAALTHVNKSLKVIVGAKGQIQPTYEEGFEKGHEDIIKLKGQNEASCC